MKAFALGALFGAALSALCFWFPYSRQAKTLSSVRAELSETKNFANHMETMRDQWQKEALKNQSAAWQAQGRRLCISTYDMPGVRHGAMFFVKEWGPRPDGACNSQDAPQDGVSVLGTDYQGGNLGCKNVDGSVSWHPREDGFCYALDMPK